MTLDERATTRREAFEAVLAQLRDLIDWSGPTSDNRPGLELAVAVLIGRIEGTK